MWISNLSIIFDIQTFLNYYVCFKWHKLQNPISYSIQMVIAKIFARIFALCLQFRLIKQHALQAQFWKIISFHTVCLFGWRTLAKKQFLQSLQKYTFYFLLFAHLSAVRSNVEIVLEASFYKFLSFMASSLCTFFIQILLCLHNYYIHKQFKH